MDSELNPIVLKDVGAREKMEILPQKTPPTQSGISFSPGLFASFFVVRFTATWAPARLRFFLISRRLHQLDVPSVLPIEIRGKLNRRD